MVTPSRLVYSTSDSISSTTPINWLSATLVPISTSPSWKVTWKRVCGMMFSIMPRMKLDIPRGTIRATVLIETILAAFEMEEILYELREHSAGLNAGRWDYIFSVIKKFAKRANLVLPDRGLITMTVPFMRAYTELMVKTCHKRGAHAIGGMAAFIPNRREPEVTQNALQKVRQDKERESNDGFDGTWVAHPDLVPVAAGVSRRCWELNPIRNTVCVTT